MECVDIVPLWGTFTQVLGTVLPCSNSNKLFNAIAITRNRYCDVRSQEVYRVNGRTFLL